MKEQTRQPHKAMAKAEEAARAAEGLGVETEKAGDLEKLRTQKQKKGSGLLP
jgi:hypothetical protein